MNEIKKYNSKATELKFIELWEQNKTYKYDPAKSRAETYTIDTPPPTVSGSLHIGHVFSYSQTDFIARYKRMKGFNVYYPMGWDDNGLPTERRIQKLFNIICDSNLSYVSDFSPDSSIRKAVSRKNFIEICSKQTLEDEKKYENLWRRLGLSIDWSQQYSTIDRASQFTAQMSFIDLFNKDFAFNRIEPTLWDIDFQSAIAQAEIEDRQQSGQLFKIKFKLKDSDESIQIATSRPELLPAIIAVVAHPDDIRYKKFFGKKIITPLFENEIVFMSSEHAKPEKGTGCLMVCTFGDNDDLIFWKKNNFPLKQIISKAGRFLEIDFNSELFLSLNPEMANQFYEKLKGQSIQNARKEIIRLLKDHQFIFEEATAIQQSVKYYEKGDRPLEIIPIRQWFIKLLEYKNQFIEQGRKINWYPENMKTRYELWVNGLNQDWSISRQRYFGVPFPVWFKIDSTGNVNYNTPLLAEKYQLPLDPMLAAPRGYTEDQRGKANGFIADPDVMDTWATSSTTPLINSHWESDPIRHKKLFPTNLRPQGHEIIRTWAFYSIAKSWMHENDIPWKEIAISGWVVDPNKNKMSKSKGNIIEPEGIIENYSADSVRYWSARARLGSDTTFDENLFKIGKKLENKIINSARFVNTFSLENYSEDTIKNPLDKSWLIGLAETVQKATILFDEFNYSAALELIEKKFWEFCDDYIEVVKSRAYNNSKNPFLETESAIASLHFSLKIFLKLFAPFMPFVTEEIWLNELKQDRSIHLSNWPEDSNFNLFKATQSKTWILCRSLVHEIRLQKSSKNMGVGFSLKKFTIFANNETIETLKHFESDLLNVSRVIPGGFTLETVLGESFKIVID